MSSGPSITALEPVETKPKKIRTSSFRTVISIFALRRVKVGDWTVTLGKLLKQGLEGWLSG